MKLNELYRVREDGTRLMLFDLVEWDPSWRERDVLIQLEGTREKRLLTAAEALLQLPCETAIEFIGGLPGGGKSLYSVKLVLDELMHSHRPIVTNLALKIARMQEYLEELGYHVNVAERVYLLRNAAEIKTFYLRRTHDLLLEMPGWDASQGKNGRWSSSVNWAPTQNDHEAAGGVFYVIDECHNWFHPEAFDAPKLTPEHPMFQWASQHRKLKDICYFVTQSVENVHVAVRRLGQQFHYIRNQRKETYRGFRRGDGFIRTTYLKQPKSESAVPIEEKKFKLDARGIASCYYTAGGVGIKTQGVGDGGFKKKGFHMRWVWGIAAAAVLVLAVILFVVPRLVLEKTIKSTVAQGVAELSDQAKAKQPVQARPLEEVARAPRGESSDVNKTPGSSSSTIVDVPTVRIIGVVGSLAKRRFVIYLSDGTTVDQDDQAVTRATAQYVVVRGQKVYFARPGPGAAPDRPKAVERKETQSTSTINVPSAPGQTLTVSGEAAPQQQSSWYTDRYGVQRLVPEKQSAPTIPPAQQSNGGVREVVRRI